MIELKSITLLNKKKTVAKDICLKLNNGRIYGICVCEELSPLFFSLLAGIRLPAEGTVLINGFDLSLEAKSAKSFLSYVPDTDVLYPSMTALEYLLFIADAHSTEYQKAIRKISDALDFTDLSMKRNMLIKNLSFYEKKRLSVAQALLSGGSIFILRSPFAGLTPTEKDHFQSLLEDVFEDCTAIIVDTDKNSLLSLCNTVYAFRDNEFTLCSPTSRLTTEEQEENN